MARERPELRLWLTRNLLILTLVSLFQDAASELLYPLLPVLLTGVLAAPPVVLGVIEGIADATAGVTRYVAGRWSDRRGRKPFIGAGYGLAAFGKVLVALARVWPVVLVGRVVDRFGKGVRSAPRDALIAVSTAPEHRGRAFGFHRTGDTLGAVIGPLIGLWALTAMHHDVRRALWWAVVPATMSVLLVALVKDHTGPPRPSTATHGTDAAPSPVDHHSPLPPEFWRVVVLLGIVAVVNFSDVLVLLRLVDLGWSTTKVVLAYVLFNSVYTLGSYPAGVLTDTWRRPTVYGVGLAAFAIGYLGLGLSHTSWVVYLCIGVYGLFPAFTDGVGKAWIASLVPHEHLGRAQGVYQGLNSGAVLVAGLWAGVLWNVGSGKGVVPLTVAGIGGVIACFAVTGSGRRAGLAR